MADLVVGMARSVVDGALTKAQAAIDEEAKLLQKAQRNLVFITGEFQMMLSFLNIAHGDRLRNPVVRTWVRQIRDLAYDVEDCIEFVVHLDKRNRWWLRLLKPGSWFMPCLAPVQLDEAVAELDRLKAMVEDVSARNARYSLINDSGSKPAVVEQQPVSGDAGRATELDRLIVAADIQKARLIDLLPEERSGGLRVISVWGSFGGDLGMASIAWETYIDEEICKSFACRAWVKLRRPFNPDEFVRSLTAQFFANACQEKAGAMVAQDVQKEMMKARQGDLLAEFAKHVNEKRFLIVLEDLSTMEEWNAVSTFFPKRVNNGSCIIVSALRFEVASLSVGRPYHVFHLGFNQLPAQHSVYAFYKMEGPVSRNNSCKKEAARKWMEEQPCDGREQERKDLDKLVVVSAVRSNQVISVWGATGVGKSALLKYFFCDKILNSRLYTKYAWVDVSYPFDLRDFSRNLLLSFDSEDIQTKGIPDYGIVGNEDHTLDCREMLRNNVCLVVIDGLKSTKEWNLIQAQLVKASNPRTSIIVISSSEESIATHCRGGPNKKPLKYHVKGPKPEVNKMGPQHYPSAISYSLKKEAAMIWMTSNPLVGRESEITELSVRATCATKSKQALSVWGIAGVGKSALVKHMFCDKILNCKLYKKYAWVDLSHPFSLWDLCRSILFGFESQDIETNVSIDHGAMGSKNPIVECREMLRDTRQRCLVVIDGLQSTKEWDLIQDGLVSGTERAWTFIVIASEESIATHCSGSSKPLLKYNVKGLELEAAIRLFYEVYNKRWPENFVAVLRELVSKCGGHPKVIIEIANLMVRTNCEDKMKERACSINHKFMQELTSSGDFGGLEGLFLWMQSYLRNCPDFLMPCIFYLLIFSRNKDIRRRRLVRRWIAEGYSRDGPEESAEENGEKQLLKLLDLDIIQQPFSLGSGGTRMALCQVNGFFREYIISQRMEENHVFELDGSCTATGQRTGRHLVISKGWVRELIVFKTIDFSRLRSLTVWGKWESFFITEGMKLLRVLDLEDVIEGHVKYSDLKKIVKWFPRLKFLSLRGRNEIRYLPSSVGNLRQLQTLDVRHTSIIALPVSITKLQRLQYIRAGTTAAADQQKPSTPHLSLSWLSDCCGRRHLAGVKIPPGIRKLTALHTLGVVNVSASGTKAFLEDLKELTQLRKLGVSGINKNNCKKFFSTISVHIHLESLLVQLDKDSEDCLDLESIPLPLEKLRSLKLHGLGDKLPAWSAKLKNITKIDLEMDKIFKQPEQDEKLEHVIMFLGMLPVLCILRVCAKQFEDDKLIVRVHKNDRELESYKQVKIFRISCRSSSKLQVTFGSNTMKKLEQLKVDCSSRSGYQFDGLKNLPELKEVCLKGPNANTQKEYLETVLQLHANEPVVKLE